MIRTCSPTSGASSSDRLRGDGMNLSKAALRARMVKAADAIPPIGRLRADRDAAAHERDRLAGELRALQAGAGCDFARRTTLVRARPLLLTDPGSGRGHC